MLRVLLFILFYIMLHSSCVLESSMTVDEVTCSPVEKYKTKNLVLVIIDGPRQSETWGHPERKYIPYLRDSLSRKSVVKSEFYNRGNTFTIPGHIAITTGSYEVKSNDGEQFPLYPSFLQSFLACSGLGERDAYLVTAKEKLKILGDCESLNFRNSFRPGMYTKDRTDLEVFKQSMELMQTEYPRVMVVHFKEADVAGHAKQWDAYLNAIQLADSLLFELVSYVEKDPFYKDQTTVIMTNDHGRHLDGIKDGFVSHGDHCLGCTHINFLAFGPDFKKDVICDIPGESIDILPTIGELMGFRTEWAEGRILVELLKK